MVTFIEFVAIVFFGCVQYSIHNTCRVCISMNLQQNKNKISREISDFIDHWITSNNIDTHTLNQLNIWGRDWILKLSEKSFLVSDSQIGYWIFFLNLDSGQTKCQKMPQNCL